jgi:SAM-dependent methyltransferase
MGIAENASGLTRDERGIWRSSRSRSLSYPSDGNQQCFALEDRSFWFNHRNDCIASLVKRNPPPGPILDVGGGNGFATRRLLDCGFDAALLEPGIVGALNGKQARGIPEVFCSTLEDAGFSDGSLSAIGCFDVIEHIEADNVFIRTTYDLLHEGGMLYGTVPAHEWLWSYSDVHAGHHRRYDRKSLTALLNDRFEVVYFTYFFGALVAPQFVLRALPFKGNRPVSTVSLAC